MSDERTEMALDDLRERVVLLHSQLVTAKSNPAPLVQNLVDRNANQITMIRDLYKDLDEARHTIETQTKRIRELERAAGRELPDS